MGISGKEPLPLKKTWDVRGVLWGVWWGDPTLDAGRSDAVWEGAASLRGKAHRLRPGPSASVSCLA